jgi:peptidoglycan/LPS O-acetylase OafA/YrhL
MGSAADRQTFQALEMLRGVAALGVLLFHVLGIVDQAHGASGRALTHGYLAVDFFFMLSGFVMSAAYARRLAQGWALRDFLLRRLKRLYPVYGAALVMGVALQLALAANAHQPVSGAAAGALVVVVAYAALFLPLLSSQDAEAFPLNGAAWSLSHELLANVTFGLFRRASACGLVLTASAGAVGCVWLLVHGRCLEAGAMQDSYLPGLARVLFAFPVGVLLHRAYAAGRLARLPRLGPVALAAALAAPLALPLRHGGGDMLLDGACVFVGFPLLLALGAVSGASSATGARLGALSYPLYATHVVLRPLWLAVLPPLDRATGLFCGLAGSLFVAVVVGRLMEPAAVAARLGPLSWRSGPSPLRARRL